MSSTMVHIMLHGLIALVPVEGTDGQLNHMTALLVDARQMRPHQCFAQHQPKLTVLASNQECVAAGCRTSAQECVCDLAFQEITLTPDVQPSIAQSPLSHRPQASLPFNRRKAMDFGYIANLAAPPLNQKLDSRFLDSVPPSGLVARMRFPFESANACALAVRPDEGGDNVHPMSFRPLGKAEREGELNQAIAQMLMVHYSLPAGSPLTLTLSDFGGANPRSMNLISGQDGYSIQLENSRPTLPIDDPCDDGVGRDFALLYDLAENPPEWNHRKIPHVKLTRWKSSAELLNDECQGPKEPMSRPVCPIGSFFPEEQ